MSPLDNTLGSTLGSFQLLAPGRIVFGWGRRAELGRLAAELTDQGVARRAWLITSRRDQAPGGLAEQLTTTLTAHDFVTARLAAAGREPTVADVDALVAQLREEGIQPGDLVIAAGGGSTIDLAKAAAALAPQPGQSSVRDYLEGVGRGLSLVVPPLPLVVLPTTAGTGSEATKNAVISVADPPCKKSLRDDRMLARLVIVDPELTVSAPPHVTAHSGLDAITQLIESYVSKRATPITRALALDGLVDTPPALVAACREPTDCAARTRMSYAALISGLTLANGGLGLAHGAAAALGSLCDVPHGLACAMLLPAAMRANLTARRGDFARLGEILAGAGGDEASRAAAAITTIENLLDELQVPRRLGQVGVRADQLDQLVRGSRGNSMDGNPICLSDDELRGILERLL